MSDVEFVTPREVPDHGERDKRVREVTHPDPYVPEIEREDEPDEAPEVQPQPYEDEAVT